MKRTLVMFLLAAAALSAACSDDGNTTTEGQGRLRIVHVSPDAPNLDVVLDGDTVASDIAYLGSSDYLELVGRAGTSCRCPKRMPAPR